MAHRSKRGPMFRLHACPWHSRTAQPKWYFLPALESNNREAFTALILLSFLFAWRGIKECLCLWYSWCLYSHSYVLIVSYSAVPEKWWSISQILIVYFIVLQKQKIGKMNKEGNVCLQAYRHKMNAETTANIFWIINFCLNFDTEMPIFQNFSLYRSKCLQRLFFT